MSEHVANRNTPVEKPALVPFKGNKEAFLGKTKDAQGINPGNIRGLILALIKLNDLTQGKLAGSAGIPSQNVSSWLMGRDNALSQDKQMKLLSILGVEYGRLRPDIVHRWLVTETEDVKTVFEALDIDHESLELLAVENSRYPFSAIAKTEPTFRKGESPSAR